MDRDRNLIFGILAVQLHKITSTQLVDVAAGWVANPTRDLSDRLVEAGLLSKEDRQLLDAFVAEAVKSNDGDTSRTLSTFGGSVQVERAFGFDIMRSLSNDDATLPGPLPPFQGIETPESESWPAVQESPGRYSHISDYAKGGMGRVLLVHDQHIGRDVALKELLPDPHAGTDGIDTPVRKGARFFSRFLQEARITGQLEHPAIVPVYELGVRRDGNLYYTMKLVRGRTLARAIDDASGLESRLELLSNFLDLCNAIAYAHSRGVIHRDIKPANIMVGEFGETVVLDWGLAKAHHHTDTAAEEMRETLRSLQLGDTPTVETAVGRALGTPRYMPPEQAKGQIDLIDERSDVYSLGAVLYEILTGRAPFEGSSVGEILRKVIENEPDPVALHAPEAPAELVAICMRALAKEPAKRYPSARELAADVRSFLSGAMVGAYNYSFAEHLRRFVQRHKAVLATAAAALLAFAGLAVASYFQIMSERDVAVEARKREEIQRRRAEEKSYLSSIQLARSAIDRKDYQVARNALEVAPAEERNWEWAYLDRISNLDAATLAGHTGSINAIAIGPDGKRIATASDDHTAIVWDRETAKILFVLKHEDRVGRVAFSHDAKRIATGCDDHTAQLWDAETGERIFVLEAHAGKVHMVQFSEDDSLLLTLSNDLAAVWECSTGEIAHQLSADRSTFMLGTFSRDGRRAAMARYDETILLWNPTTNEELNRPSGHTGDLQWVEFSADGTLLATASLDTTARIWNTDTLEVVTTLEGHQKSLSCARFSPDGGRILTASWDNTAKLWDARSGALLATLEGHELPLRWAEFSPDGARILTASMDRTTRVWATESAALQAVLGGHSLPVWQSSFSPDGRDIITASDDGEAKAWLAGNLPHNDLFTLAGHGDDVLSMTFSPDGLAVATNSGDGSARIWDIASGSLIASCAGHLNSVWTSAFDQNGGTLVTAGDDGTAGVFNAQTGERIALLGIEGEDRFMSIDISPDGARAVTGSHNGTPTVWDLASGQALFQLEGHAAKVDAARYSPDGARIVTASRDNTAKIWDAGTGEEIRTLSAHTAELNDAQFSPDGDRVVTASFDGNAILWDASNGGVIAVLAGHTHEVRSAEFSVDGGLIVTASSDYSAAIWDGRTGAFLHTLSGHRLPVRNAHFSPDASRVVTASEDGTAKIWETASGAEMCELVGHTEGVIDARFTPDGAMVVTVSHDDTAKIWGVFEQKTGSLIARQKRTTSVRQEQAALLER